MPIRSARSASAASASGRTFEGPQPKRPSAGFSSAGIWVVSVVCGRHRGDRLLTGAGGLRAGAGGRLAAPSLAVPSNPRGNRCIRSATKPISTRRRTAWTTFFRLLLAIPWFIVATFWGILFVFTHLFAWVAVVILGRYPQWLYNFNSGVVRFSIRTSAWIYLQTDVWPPFGLSDDPSYPIRVNFAAAGASARAG